MSEAAPAPVAAPAAETTVTTDTTAAAPAEAKADAKAGEAKPVRGPDGKFAPAEAKPATSPQRVKLTVDGQEEEVDLDEAIRRAAKASAADKRFREAAEERKAAAEDKGKIAKFLTTLKDSPDAFARELAEFAKMHGADPAKVAEAILAPLIQAEIDAEEEKLLTPEQKQAKAERRELADLKRQAAERKAQDEAAEKAKQDAAQQAEVAKHREELSTTVMKALEATKLPKTHETALELVNLLEDALSQGLDLTPAQLAKDLESRRLGEWRSVVEADEGLDLVPAKVLERARKADVEAFKKQNPMAAAKPVVGDGKKPGAEAAKPGGRSIASITRDLMMGRLK